MAFYPGRASSVTISASARPYNQFDLDFNAEIVDTTNFTSSGYQENVTGITKADISFSGPYDGAEGLAPGDSVSLVFALGGGGPSFTVTTRLSSIKINTAASNQVAQISVSGTSNGTFSVTI
jgi:hypothetical protein